jgi:DNA-binding CsgD family transcriptional regulator
MRSSYLAPNLDGVAAAAVQRQIDALIALCRSDLAAGDLRDQVLARLRKLVPVDAAFFATVDPASMLFTSAVADEPLSTVTELFLENEFAQTDVNKFAVLAMSQQPVTSLDRATAGDRGTSPRYREIMAPLALGDELRAALVVGGRCWGVMCLHREDDPTGFSDGELRLIRRLVPHLAAGFRRAVLVDRALSEPTATGPGIVVLDKNLSIVSCNPEGQFWLDQLSVDARQQIHGLPTAVLAVAARMSAGEDEANRHQPARARVRAADGQWLVVHASRLMGAAAGQIAIVFEPAHSMEMSSMILDAHGITPAQSRVAALVLQGRSTQQIVNDLAISSNTVQEHLRAVFDKFGVGSRRELVALLLSGPH